MGVYLVVRLCTLPRGTSTHGLVLYAVNWFKSPDVFVSPGGVFWANQKAGIEGLGTWPLSVSQTIMGAEPNIGHRMATLVQVCLQPVLERNEREEPLTTLEMTCESRGYVGVGDLKSVNFKKLLKEES